MDDIRITPYIHVPELLYSGLVDRSSTTLHHVAQRKLARTTSILVHLVLIKSGGVPVKLSYAYSLLMRANKLETAAVQESLACLAPP